MRQLQIQAAEKVSARKIFKPIYARGAKISFIRCLEKRTLPATKKSVMEAKKPARGDCIELFLAEDTIEKFREIQMKKKLQQSSD